MLLTISTSHRPATDLGFLLFKHPDRVSKFEQSYGTAWVFYPEATEERCTVALLVEVDSDKLARAAGRGGKAQAGAEASLANYVNDRPYAASSLLGSALASVFNTARSGRGGDFQALADGEIPLEIDFPVLPAKGGVKFVYRIFEPLGWQVEATPISLDERFPEWGNSPYVHLNLKGNARLADALNQLHVLLPVLDKTKHYWQGDAEVEKLLRSGGGWLAGHPSREEITRRYLLRSTALTNAALARLSELDDDADDDATDSVGPDEASKASENYEGSVSLSREATAVVVEPPTESLSVLRHQAVLAALRNLDATSVLDLGCGSGALLTKLVKEPKLTRIVGVDVSTRALEIAARRLHLDELSERAAARLAVFQSALTYEDSRLQGFDAAILMEVIEHVDPERLPALERAVFGFARPVALIVTTPNAEYNELYEGLTDPSAETAVGGYHRLMRHTDHRFEWNRAQFADWANQVAADYGYQVEFEGVGRAHPVLGTPTQMAIFKVVTNNHLGGDDD